MTDETETRRDQWKTWSPFVVGCPITGKGRDTGDEILGSNPESRERKGGVGSEVCVLLCLCMSDHCPVNTPASQTT